MGIFVVALIIGIAAAFGTVNYVLWDAPRTVARADENANVLLISIDTLRPDHLSLYGYPRPTSPEIERFFADGEIWNNVYATEASTAPSMASILTGRLPQNHRVRLFYQHLAEDVPTLADILRDAGYQSGAVVSNIVLTSEAMGLDSRFDHYDDFVDEHEGHRAVWERGASRTTDAAIGWFEDERDPSEAHFLWVHYIDPHGPYRAPETKPRTFSHEGRKIINVNRVPNYTRLEEDSDDALAYVDRYDEEIAYVDSEIGRLLKAYEEAGLLDDTIVVLTADHGESMTDAWHYFAHGFDVVEPVMRVPLAVRRPGGPRARYVDPVSTLDIVPSILSWLELPQVGNLDGYPLGKRPDDAPVSLEATSRLGQRRAAILGREKWTLIRNGEGKLVKKISRTLPIVDPSSSNPQTSEPKAEPWREGSVAEILEGWVDADDYPESVVARENMGRKLGGPKVAPGRTERQLEGLRALGYVE